MTLLDINELIKTENLERAQSALEQGWKMLCHPLADETLVLGRFNEDRMLALIEDRFTRDIATKRDID